jgi:hypothetical protein
VHRLAIRAAGVEGDLLDFLDGFKGAGGPLGVGCLSEACFQLGCKCLGLDDGLYVLVALNIALIARAGKWCGQRWPCWALAS